MTKGQRKNVAASVKQRLLNLARERGEEFNLVLVHYGMERLLYRLSQSDQADAFVLKGAMLFHLFSDIAHRPTRDLELLGSGAPNEGRLEAIFADLCSLPVEDDGLTFDGKAVRASRYWFWRRDYSAPDEARHTVHARFSLAAPEDLPMGDGSCGEVSSSHATGNGKQPNEGLL